MRLSYVTWIVGLGVLAWPACGDSSNGSSDSAVVDTSASLDSNEPTDTQVVNDRSTWTTARSKVTRAT